MKTPSRTVLAAALGLALLSAAPALAGVIRGHVELPQVAPGSRVRDAYAGRASALSTPGVPARGLAKDAVVYVETVPSGVEIRAAATEPAKLAQQDQAFVPRVIAVAAGSSVDFPNLDPIYHSVFSVSPTKRFDLGRYGRGKSKRVVFAKPGLVNVYCDIHSNMEGFVFVVPNRAFARPDDDGRFALPELPAGRYTVVVWHPDGGTARREVVVPASGDVDVALRLAP